MTTPTLLGMSGLLRSASFNRLLLGEAARLFGDAHFTEADLRLPLYDGDLEEAQGILLRFKSWQIKLRWPMPSSSPRPNTTKASLAS